LSGINTNCLKTIAKELKQRYSSEWESNKEDTLQILQDISEILNREQVTRSDIERVRRFLGQLPRDIRRLFTLSHIENKLDNLLETPHVDELKQVALNISGELEQYQELAETLRIVLENTEDFGIAGASALLALLNPKFFFPINKKVIPSSLRGLIALPPIEGGQISQQVKSIKPFIEFMRHVHEIQRELNIESAIEFGFYLSKFNEKEFSDICGVGDRIMKKLNELLNKKGQVILYGPPGTGKTWLARKYVVKETNEDKPGDRWEFITFHQSYSYEEFIEGFRPKTDDNGSIRYEVEDGIFKKIALRALVKGLLELENASIDRDELQKLHGLLLKKEPLSFTEYEEYLRLKRYLGELVAGLPDENLRELTPKFYIIIDEINRGNISKIFGELITLLEKDKRLGGENQLIVRLPYSGEPFAVPPNLYIIGTMNTADRSIALLDVALRRRFAFIEVEPRPEFLKKENLKEIIKEKLRTEEEKQRSNKKLNELFSKLDSDDFLENLLKTINVRITAVKDRDHRIGHSYFLNVETVDDLKRVWYYEVLPLLIEYFYNDWETIKWVLNGEFIKEISKTRDGEPVYDITPIEEIENDENFIKALKNVINTQNGENRGSNNQHSAEEGSTETN